MCLVVKEGNGKEAVVVVVYLSVRSVCCAMVVAPDLIGWCVLCEGNRREKGKGDRVEDGPRGQGVGGSKNRRKGGKRRDEKERNEEEKERLEGEEKRREEKKKEGK